MSLIDFNDSLYLGLLDGNAPTSPSSRQLATVERPDDSSLPLSLVAGGGEQDQVSFTLLRAAPIAKN